MVGEVALALLEYIFECRSPHLSSYPSFLARVPRPEYPWWAGAKLQYLRSYDHISGEGYIG